MPSLPNGYPALTEGKAGIDLVMGVLVKYTAFASFKTVLSRNAGHR